MKPKNRITIKQPDDFDILSAAWVLACNDDNPIMTYKGILYRLNLPNDYDAVGLIRSRGELYRMGIPKRRLDKWKTELQNGRGLSSWIRDVEDASAREKMIESLTSEEVFRSQFRTEEDAPRSSLEIIDWGLQHIDRLRKANLEAREESIKSLQLWSVLVLSILNLAITVVSLLIRK